MSIDDNRKLRIYEDVNKKGVVIANLEEVLVKSAKDGIKVLQRGKRQEIELEC